MSWGLSDETETCGGGWPTCCNSPWSYCPGLVNPRFGVDFASTQLELVGHTLVPLLVRKELCPGFLDIGARVCSQGHG